MNPRLWWALGAFALALVLLAPSLAPLPASMDEFASELSNGTFRPFGPPGGKGLVAGPNALGGFTGASTGNYVAGAGDVPNEWALDRESGGGAVVIDYVCNPSPGAMKRLKAFDQLGPDGATLEVADKRLRPVEPDKSLTYDSLVACSFPVQIHPGTPVPIFSVAPKGFVVSTWSTDPPLARPLSFLKDGADTFYVLGNEEKRVTLNLTFLVDSGYFSFSPPPGARVSDYARGLVPALPPGIADAAKIVMARAGVKDPTLVGPTLDALNAYFRSFTDGPIPGPDEVDSLYLALALSGHGCCRHRAFAYMVTAQAAGIPARVVVNEAHAFPEVMFPDGSWHQVNLGGCGAYTVNNPNNYPSLFDAAAEPRREANPDEGRPQTAVATFTNITEAPPRMVKGEVYFVNGTVEASNGRPVGGAPVDLYLNATKATKGKLMTSGQTDAFGRFSIQSRVPVDVAAQGYQLVASGGTVSAGPLRYEGSWSDPAVDVFTPTRIVLAHATAAAGFPANATGRLVDVDGNPVGPATIRWSIGSTQERDLQADSTGLFTAAFQANATGSLALSFSYDGDAHHGASQADEVVAVTRGTILAPANAPILLRGEVGLVSGDLAVSGASLAGRLVTVALTNATRIVAIPPAQATTDASGHFVARVRVPANALPGAYAVDYRAPDLQVNATGVVRVAIRPGFVVEAPSRVGPTEGWTATAQVTSDDGSALGGGIVELHVDGNATPLKTLLTNATGVARFQVEGGALPPGDHAITLAFAGDRDRAPAEQTANLRVLPPFWALVPAWVWIALGSAALVGGLGAWLLRPGGVVRRVVLRPRWRIDLSWPDFPPGVAPVAEPGTAVRVVAQAFDAQGRPRKARFVLVAPGVRLRSKGEFELRAGEPGVLPLEVKARGRARWLAAPALARLPVATYRAAVEQGFVALRGAAKLDASATPGDLVDALSPKLEPAPRASLAEAARLFETADYSEAPVDRAFYHAFAQARHAVERALEGADG